MYKYLHMSIRITDVTGDPGRSEKKYIYQDISLDLVEEPVPTSSSLHSKATTKDIRVSRDEGAIMNALKNIFTTTPGEKILNPSFGVNLTQWLFEPIGDYAGREIGETIMEGIKRFEPRVIVDNIDVIIDIENSQYEIKLVLTIPSLNIINKRYEAILNQPGFEFLGNR